MTGKDAGSPGTTAGDTGGSTPGPPAGFPLSLQLAGITRRVREAVDTRLADDGLSLRHLGVLGHLAASPGLSISELARRAGISAPSMLATIRELEAGGLVERTTPNGRGNTAQLRLTGAGRTARATALAALAALDDVLLADFSPGQRDALAAVLRDLAAALMKPPPAA
ncbi:MarR family winged helix-turn-helix transcriptional regulator [Streptomyces longwoodensis]|uniref:MarR family winged helix-turn-helix transcriptional regulator n=1 Tax=Streptomyces longwoodensis TaxID=68231 RepID=UPI0033D3D00B